jgi:hypothetical protein
MNRMPERAKRRDDNNLPGSLKPMYNSADNSFAGYSCICVKCQKEFLLPIYDKREKTGFKILGDREKIETLTVRPSIEHECGWRGWLFNGEYICL